LIGLVPWFSSITLDSLL